MTLRLRGLKTDEARVTEEIEKLDEKLDGYERILSKQKYIAGDVRHFIIDANMNTAANLSGIGLRVSGIHLCRCRAHHVRIQPEYVLRDRVAQRQGEEAKRGALVR